MKFTQPLKTCWLIILIFLVSALHGCAAKAPATANQPGTQVLLNKIEPREVDGKTEITIEGSEPVLQYTSFQLTEPLRLVVDISDASIGNFQDKITVNSGAVTDITPSQKDNIARLEIGLSQSVESKVYQSGGKLVVELNKPVEEAKSASETGKPAPEADRPLCLRHLRPYRQNLRNRKKEPRRLLPQCGHPPGKKASRSSLPPTAPWCRKLSWLREINWL